MIRTSIYRNTEGWTVKQTFNPDQNNFRVVFQFPNRRITTVSSSMLTPAQAEEQILRIIDLFNELVDSESDA